MASFFFYLLNNLELSRVNPPPKKKSPGYVPYIDTHKVLKIS